jgi:hypothetical protein
MMDKETERQFEVLIKADGRAILGGAACEHCGHVTNLGGTGDGWKCTNCDKWAHLPAEEIYRRRRAVLLQRKDSDYEEHQLRLALMLDAVTLTVPDLDAIAAEPWPESKYTGKPKPKPKSLNLGAGDWIFAAIAVLIAVAMIYAFATAALHG